MSSAIFLLNPFEWRLKQLQFVCSQNWIFSLKSLVQDLGKWEERGGGVVAHPSSKEWLESSKCGFIWRFSLAGKAYIHPASHDKEVKMSNGRNKISTQASFEVSVIYTLLPWAMVCFIVTLRCCHGMSTFLTQINDSRFASWFLLIAGSVP